MSRARSCGVAPGSSMLKVGALPMMVIGRLKG